MNTSHHSWDVSNPVPQDEDLSVEKQAAIRKIRRLMDFWQIEPHELTGVVYKIAPPPATEQRPAHQYRHPLLGDTWNGRGPQPEWLKRALLTEGYTVDELRVQSPMDGDP
jgi:DNA-binding protein H-NS